MTSRLIKRILLLLVAALCGVSQAAPVSDNFRERLSRDSSDSFSQEEDVKAEILFGRVLAARIFGKYSYYENEKLNSYLNKVGKGLAQFAGRPEIEFRFAVLDTNTVNAFAAPGGYIFVTKGAIGKMEDEAELAAVLSHEIAHVTERHIVRELNIKATDASAVSGFAQVLGGGSGAVKAVFSQMVDKATEILFEKGLKKEDEFDADRVSVIISSSAGYDPNAINNYFKKISAAESETKSLSGTHPSFADRVRNVEMVLAENQLQGKKYTAVKERFKENVKIN